MGRIAYSWNAPNPAGPVYVIFASQTTGKDWVFQLSGDVTTKPVGNVMFNPRKVADAACTTLCVTAKVAGTGAGNYLPTDSYTTQMTFRNDVGAITKSSTSALSVAVFARAPEVSSPRGQTGVDPDGLNVDFEIPISHHSNSRLVKFTGQGACSASTAAVRLLGAGSAGSGVRVHVQYDPFEVTASTRLTYAQTGSPTPYQTYPQSSAGPTWTPGARGTPTPSWVTPTPSVTSTPSFTPAPISAISTSTEGKLIRGCGYTATVEYNSVLQIPGLPDQAPYISQFNTWYSNSTSSPTPTPTGVCATPAEAFTTSPSPTCANLQPAGHTVTSSFVIPDVPDAPTGLSTSHGDGEVVISHTPPDSNFSDINRYEVTFDDGAHWITYARGASPVPITVQGLTNGTQYTFKIRAGNGVGVGPWSEPITGTPMTTPSAPDVEVTRADSQATVAITGPVNNGGSEITNYQYSLDDGSHWTSLDPPSTTSPFTITGLMNGTAYPIKVRAVNDLGPGAASATVEVTPCTAPGKPASLEASGAAGSVDVVTGITTTGGCPMTDYEYKLDARDWISSGDTDGAFRITGLTNGTAYEVRVRALNEVGAGPASDPADFSPGALPGAPMDLVYTPGDRGGTVAFTPPYDGGRAITAYQYQVADGPWTDVDPPAISSPIALLHLMNGRTYSVRIRAVNAMGGGAASEWESITPGTVPTEPIGVAVAPGDRSARVTFTVPAGDGGRTITGYEYQLDKGDWTAAESPLLLSGLVNDAGYELRVRAVNELGAGNASAPVAFSPSGSEPPAPSQASKRAQRVVVPEFRPPKRIALTGLTVITRRGARTNAGQRIRTRVSGGTVAQGEVRYFTIERGPRGETSIRMFGHRYLRILVRQYAPATATYRAYQRRAVYIGGNRQ